MDYLISFIIFSPILLIMLISGYADIGTALIGIIIGFIMIWLDKQMHKQGGGLIIGAIIGGILSAFCDKK